MYGGVVVKNVIDLFRIGICKGTAINSILKGSILLSKTNYICKRKKRKM